MSKRSFQCQTDKQKASFPAMHKHFAVAARTTALVLTGTMLTGSWCTSLAEADGFVDSNTNSLFYGFKSDASYAQQQLHVKVTFYNSASDAINQQNEDPLGQFVRIEYVSNCPGDEAPVPAGTGEQAAPGLAGSQAGTAGGGAGAQAAPGSQATTGTTSGTAAHTGAGTGTTFGTGTSPASGLTGSQVATNATSAANALDVPNAWTYRPQWWFGVPLGVDASTIQNITLQYNDQGKCDPAIKTFKPAQGSTDGSADSGSPMCSTQKGYYIANQKTYANIDDWKSITHQYLAGADVALDGTSWNTLIGNKSDGSFDTAGGTWDAWESIKPVSSANTNTPPGAAVAQTGSGHGATQPALAQTNSSASTSTRKPLQGVFVDWETTGTHFYRFSYVAKLTDDAWKHRSAFPLTLASGVCRSMGSWRIAAAQNIHVPVIAQSMPQLVYPQMAEVDNAKHLNDAEKRKLVDAIRTANNDNAAFANLLAKENAISVADDGTATITMSDGSTTVMPGMFLVRQKQVQKMSELYRRALKLPDLQGVVNVQKLTPTEQTSVTQAIITANMNVSAAGGGGAGGAGQAAGTDKQPNDVLKHLKLTNNAYEIRVSTTGEATLTFSDNSTLTLPAYKLVYQKAPTSQWTSFILPSYIEVAQLSQLSPDERATIKQKFAEANEKVVPFMAAQTAAKALNKDALSVAENGDVTITWADGSSTCVKAWQFLKRKGTSDPAPQKKSEPKKEFSVACPATLPVVDFDPYHTTQADATTYASTVETLKDTLKKCKVTDITAGASTGTSTPSAPAPSLQITQVAFNFEQGTITFTVDGYQPAVYPMGYFLTQAVSKQNPMMSTLLVSRENKNGNITYKYNITKTAIAGNKPTLDEAKTALKRFFDDNYDYDPDEYDFTQGLTDIDVHNNRFVHEKQGTDYLWVCFSSDAGVTEIKLLTDESKNDFGGIVVRGRETDDASEDTTMFSISASDLYFKKEANKDYSYTSLQTLARDLVWKQRQAGVTDSDFVASGVALADIVPSAIDQLSDVGKLRALIAKVRAARHKVHYLSDPLSVEAKDYNTNQYTDEQVRKAVIKFILKNYDGATEEDITRTLGTINNDAKKYWLVTKNDAGNLVQKLKLTPKAGTRGIELASDDNPRGIAYFVTWGALGFYDINTDYDNADPTKRTPFMKPLPDELIRSTDYDARLKAQKDDAKQSIQHNPYLTSAEKVAYVKKIDALEHLAQIPGVFTESQAQGKNNHAKTGDAQLAEQIQKHLKGEADEKTADSAAQSSAKEQEQKHEGADLQTQKTAVADAIKNMKNLSQAEKDALNVEIVGDGTLANQEGATTIDAVVAIKQKAQLLNAAHEALDGDKSTTGDKALLPKLSFLDHGTGAEGNTVATHADDAALVELLNKPAQAQADEKLKALTGALTANPLDVGKLQSALTAAQQANLANKHAAQQKVLDTLARLTHLTDAHRKTAQEAILNAATPSALKKALSDVQIQDKNDTPQLAKPTRDKTGNTNDDAKTLSDEKTQAKARIEKIKGLTAAQVAKLKSDIDATTRVGDPTAIANRAEKAQKIADALKEFSKFTHLNNAQVKAFQGIINHTGAANMTGGAPQKTHDDIDSCLVQAAATDGAMERLSRLVPKAENLKKADAYKNAAQDKKAALEKALSTAQAILKKETGDPKDAAGVDALYDALLRAMFSIDAKAKGVGANVAGLEAEIATSQKLLPTKADATHAAGAGDDKYVYATKALKDAFDGALSTAKTALSDAKNANPKSAAEEQALQLKVNAAQKVLTAAREALDGKAPTPQPQPQPQPQPRPQPSPLPDITPGPHLNPLPQPAPSTPSSPSGDDHTQPNNNSGQQNGTQSGETNEGAGTQAGAGTGAGTGAGEGAGTEAGAGTQGAQGAGTEAGAGTQGVQGDQGAEGAGAGAGAGAGSQAAAGAGNAAQAGKGAGSAAVDADALKAAVATAAQASAPRNANVTADALSSNASLAANAHGKHARLAKTADAAPVGAFALMTCAAAGLLGAGALRRKVKNARHSRR